MVVGFNIYSTQILLSEKDGIIQMQSNIAIDISVSFPFKFYAWRWRNLCRVMAAVGLCNSELDHSWFLMMVAD